MGKPGEGGIRRYKGGDENMRKVLEVLIKIIRLVLTCATWVVSITYMVMTINEDSFIRSYSFLTLVRLVVIGLIVFAVIFTWQKYNYHKFGKLDRRKFPQPVTADNMGEIFAVSGETVEEFRSSTSLSLELVREYNKESDSIVDRLMMLSDTSEYEISPPYTARAAAASAPREHEEVAVQNL